MTTGTAFGISENDIENVLHAYSLRVANTDGQSFADIALELINEIDHARVEEAALAAGCDNDQQTNAAYREIKSMLIEMGVLEF